jgi:TAT (twin-arginine translocation) pathway-exported protein
MLQLDVDRREFLKINAGAGAALAIPTSGHTAVPLQSDRYPGRSRFVCG